MYSNFKKVLIGENSVQNLKELWAYSETKYFREDFGEAYLHFECWLYRRSIIHF